MMDGKRQNEVEPQSDEDEDEEFQNDSSNDGCGRGCISFVLGIIVIWALIFGVTVDGKHYGIHQCSWDNGVEIHTGQR